MKELSNIINYYAAQDDALSKMALATVVHVEQSSYRRSGARMLIHLDGNWTGGISGGCLEGDTLKKAKLAILEKKSTIVRYDTRDGDENQIGVGLGCNGLIDVLINPIANFATDPFTIFKACTQRRFPSILITVITHPTTAKQGLLLDMTEKSDTTSLSLPETVDSILKEKIASLTKSQTVSIDGPDGAYRFFLEYIPPIIHVMICGRNYDTIPLSRICNELGWKVSIVSNPLKTNKTLYELSDQVLSSDAFNSHIDKYTVCLLMAHDYATDMSNFIKVLASETPYIGILGPKKRSSKMIKEVSQQGIEVNLDRIYAPIGLDTGATTPEEIAISIVAEITSHFKNRKGNNLRDRVGSIND